MKKFFAAVAIAIVSLFSANTADAQSLNNTDLKAYAQEQYGKNWGVAAQKAADQMDLDAEGNLTLTRTIQAPGMSQNDLYYEVADWFISNYQNAIQMVDKEDGLIIARPYLSNIATSAAGWNAYKFDICPTIRVKVSDGLVNIEYKLKDYGVAEEIGGGNVTAGVLCGLAATAIVADVCTTEHTTVVEHHRHGHHHTYVERTYVRRPYRAIEDALVLSCVANAASSSRYDDAHEVWQLKNCYPFVAKDNHKKASARAFVMASTYSQAFVNDMETAINNSQLAYK